VVEHLPYQPKVEGLSLAAASGTGIDKIAKRRVFCESRYLCIDILSNKLECLSLLSLFSRPDSCEKSLSIEMGAIRGSTQKGSDLTCKY
jgi:hypothetical protein